MNVKLLSSEMCQNIRRQIPEDNNRYTYISAERTDSFGSPSDLYSGDADSNLGQYTNCPEIFRSVPQFLKDNAKTDIFFFHYLQFMFHYHPIQ
jgi:hypothetical protein